MNKQKKQKKSLFKSTFLLSNITLISRILGFIRDMLFAKYFGATATMEAFLVAFRVPNFMRRLFVEGSLTQVLVPSLSKQSSHKRLNYLFSTLLNIIALTSLLVSLIGIIFASIWVMVFAPGFYHDQTQFVLAKELLQIMFPYVFFISISALFSALLNRYEHFNIPALMPCILNVCMIGFILSASHFKAPIYAVAWSVFIAGFIQSVILFIYVRRLSVKLTLSLRKPSYHLKRILKSLLPGILGASVVQISLLLDTIFASFLAVGSLSWLYYPDRLNQFPLGVFGIAIATAILPKLSNIKTSAHDFSQIVNWGMKLSLIITIPAAFAMSVLSAPILITLFQYGKFSAFDVIQSQRALICFAIGLIAFVLIKVFISALYAKGHTKEALKIGVICIICNILSNILLILILKTHHLGYLALSISTTVTAAINALLLYIALKRITHVHLDLATFTLIVRAIIAASIMFLVLYYLKQDIGYWLALSFKTRVLHLSMIIGVGIFSYFACLFLVGVRLKHIKLSV
ncbi:murein biosynthesis integral membrane protein MurJ [Cysteiniphilum sp. QT6929]|uniref:murein biosynthesis integral membrane protein MurJ n=1 Tax=Cysteiniphilum sp. QT6929 TaxID=2975055 RepID=UPI0024B38DAC|nr:murein biosynthesis integral membrane protein MurJ [Cysteiniphilum sp. QT6929]WHN65164.1 murein biosynthesis integral membrane protein MurJ [Cysteiniphilum sp. QT6929]